MTVLNLTHSSYVYSSFWLTGVARTSSKGVGEGEHISVPLASAESPAGWGLESAAGPTFACLAVAVGKV